MNLSVGIMWHILISQCCTLIAFYVIGDLDYFPMNRWCWQLV